MSSSISAYVNTDGFTTTLFVLLYWVGGNWGYSKGIKLSGYTGYSFT